MRPLPRQDAPAVFPTWADRIPGAAVGRYQLVFPEGIRAYGVSATTTVNAVNVAAESRCVAARR